ncbi:glutathione S-transferase Mu 2 isoform 1 [Reticulomyxa filosa]|uniref:glutathione transferase n=1 Tax=Reticulomyxa filosa TaxID=46433 RepID=X6MFV4_RETFI|nr:glutathione S-transferase Mu 2 isoform 1 [Reticulomyxa filosa]|eukprot:ETO12784.1 glutathione S-transferase Mu 2 isoform 1 [Reticulomyxa filosa]
MATALEKIDAILFDLEKLTGQSSFSAPKPRFTLAYWKIRGLAQPARLILAYGGHSNFEDVAYTIGPAPEYSRSEWLDVKFSLDLDFPNLPYLIDHYHNLRITESHAIYRCVVSPLIRKSLLFLSAQNFVRQRSYRNVCISTTTKKIIQMKINDNSYLARELGIGSTNSKDIARDEMIGDTLKDLFSQWAKVCYSPVGGNCNSKLFEASARFVGSF